MQYRQSLGHPTLLKFTPRLHGSWMVIEYVGRFPYGVISVSLISGWPQCTVILGAAYQKYAPLFQRGHIWFTAKFPKFKMLLPCIG